MTQSMRLNFSSQQLRDALQTLQTVPAQTRRSLLGMMRNQLANADLGIGLARMGLADIDWQHHCQCGWCDPQPVANLR